MKINWSTLSCVLGLLIVAIVVTGLARKPLRNEPFTIIEGLNPVTEPDPKDYNKKPAVPPGVTPVVAEYIQSTIGHALSTVGGAVQGPQGAPGPVGARGAAGGTYTRQGPVRSKMDTSLFVDRPALLVKPGASREAFLATQSFEPGQTWSLDSQTSRLLNHAGHDQCLMVDGNTVVIGNCTGAPTNIQQWSHDNKGRLVSRKQSLCLTAGGDKKLTVQPCGGGANQVWSFY